MNNLTFDYSASKKTMNKYLDLENKNVFSTINSTSKFYIMLGIVRFVIGLSRKIYSCLSVGSEQWNYGVGES